MPFIEIENAGNKKNLKPKRCKTEKKNWREYFL